MTTQGESPSSQALCCPVFLKALSWTCAIPVTLASFLVLKGDLWGLCLPDWHPSGSAGRITEHFGEHGLKLMLRHSPDHKWTGLCTLNFCVHPTTFLSPLPASLTAGKFETRKTPFATGSSGGKKWKCLGCVSVLNWWIQLHVIWRFGLQEQQLHPHVPGWAIPCPAPSEGWSRLGTTQPSSLTPRACQERGIVPVQERCLNSETFSF